MTQKREEKKKMSMYIFPAVLIALDVGAAIMCFIGKDYKKGVYCRTAHRGAYAFNNGNP
jgi:hypothetical protein